MLRMTYGRLRPLLGALLCAALLTGGCTAEPEADTRAKHSVTLVKPGKLTVCTEIPFPPFEYQDRGEVVGFDVDVLRLVAAELGVKPTFKNEPFEEIRSGRALNKGRCDVAAAGILITKGREKQLDLSDSYFELRQGLLVKADKPYRDLKSLGSKKVGVERDTTGAAYLTKQIREQRLKLEPVSYEDLSGLQQAVTTGDVEAAIADLPIWTEYAKQTPGAYQVAAEFDTGEQYGIAVKNGNSTLLKVINDVIATSKQDGTYDKIYQKWIAAPGS
ncbi:MAG: ABC transporter substrate-binding protein [Micromonosporaceae bacterium]